LIFRQALESSLRLDGVITVVDSLNVTKYLANPETSHDVRMQLAFADRILLNKSDLVPPEKVCYTHTSNRAFKITIILPLLYAMLYLQMATIEQAVRQVNSSAEVRHTSYAEISPDWVLDSDSYSLSHMKSLPMMKEGTASTTAAKHDDDHAHDHSHSHDHDHSDGGDCSQCVPTAAQPHSASTLSTHSFLIEGRMDLLKLKICLDRLLYSFDEEVETSGTTPSGAIVGEKRTHGSDHVNGNENTPPPPPTTEGDSNSSTCRIYRMKGVFQVAEGADSNEQGVALHILQAVHDVFDIQRSDVVPGSPDDKSEGLNKIIVIGKQMDKATLEDEFRQCLV
jgi:G3E family GTPase